MKKEFDTQTYNASKTFLYSFGTWILAMMFLFFFAINYGNGVVAAIGTVVLMILPFLFQKKVKNIFTRKAHLEFDDNELKIFEFHLKSYALIKETTFKWGDIKTYRCFFASDGLTYFTFYLKNGSKMKYGFKDNNSEEEAFNQESVFSLFHFYIRTYNSTHSQSDKILLKPGFITTESGGGLLWAIAILGMITMIIHLMLDAKTSVFSLIISLTMIFSLLAKRKDERRLAEKIRTLTDL